ncbi:hypothetical protein EW146_g63 [Bondarzewia mesenterica]|uniref:ubiquitinyl hydrolase 1 n=1 Tax=Bondarzewia mesenterica TaxID=1095465 RepID=A0A4S4MAE0_9AGAM|nr:hypothetical protein EW146_g63 [Bondarzewia mesenterica]
MTLSSSPKSSHTITANDTTTSRKRQRSSSMDSTTSSSSPKRSASEDPTSVASADNTRTRSPRTQFQDISHLSSSDPTSNDIDAYMVSQGEADIPQTIVPDSISPTTPQAEPADIYSRLQERQFLIETARKKPMNEGDTWYVVSQTWFSRWKKAVSGIEDKEGGVLDEKDLGPVDNSDILEANGELLLAAEEGFNVEFVPEDAWHLLVNWYGQPSHPISRKVIRRGMRRQLGLELQPPRLRVFRLTDAPNSTASSSSRDKIFINESITASVRDLIKDLATAVGSTSTEDHRVWKVDAGDTDGSEYPSGFIISSFRDDEKISSEILEPSDRTLEDELIESTDAFAVEFAKNGKWLISLPIDKKTTAVSALDVAPPPLFSHDSDFFSRLGQSSTSTSTAVVSSISGTVSSSSIQASSVLLKPAAPISVSSTNRRKQQSQAPGTLGLGNMGNTCFMNSALQCLAHTKELIDYFLSGVYKEELNTDNPLGMNGEIAESFVHTLPASSNPYYNVFAPQFSGYQQHDSQELVAFLLDGLHEDLNRVLKKPYVEKPDWEGGGDRELIKLARDSWEGYMKRNDSVIVDLFQGQYKSTLVCPECQKISITFDPFMYLTLPLPVQKKWRHTIYYIPWDLDKPHVKVPVEINRDASFKDLRNLLSRWMGSDPDNLLTLETFSHRFYKNLDDSLLCGEMAEGDNIVCYELPCHAQQARTYSAKKTDNDPFIVPVFLCDAAPTRQTTFARSGPNLFGHPFVVAVSQEDARSVKRMHELVNDRLQRWTRNARDLWSWEAPDSEMEEVRIPRVADAITEITENGDVVTVESILEEGDIVDEKNVVLHDEDTKMEDATRSGELQRVGPKTDVFSLRLQINHKDYGAGYVAYGANSQRYESWENRRRTVGTEENDHPILLREDDAFFLEFDENMKAYYFGEDSSRWEHATFHTWETFTHPEYAEAVKQTLSNSERGISLQDCLDEFTKEEQLGEDDPWYCPRCKKHQQATKKFDLWNVPDVLVVHLKRFSNSRALRDKIETFVDFPLTGLDLTEMVKERKVAKALRDEGVDIDELSLGDLDEPLVYDLYGVDEHLGGLGGGHYRAYAYNHVTDEWYHFDDSYVTPSRPEAAVNANAYLLFYKRRASRPLGGKSHAIIEAARIRAETEVNSTENSVAINADSQLPTPPNEPVRSRYPDEQVLNSVLQDFTQRTAALQPYPGHWPMSQSGLSSLTTTPPPLEEGDYLPSFENAKYDDIIDSALDPLALSTRQFDFPDPSSKASPTSSIEAELDSDDDRSTGAQHSKWGANGLYVMDDSSFQQSDAFEELSRQSSRPGSSTEEELVSESPYQNSSDLDDEDDSDPERARRRRHDDILHVEAWDDETYGELVAEAEEERRTAALREITVKSTPPKLQD